MALSPGEDEIMTGQLPTNETAIVEELALVKQL